MSDNKIPTKPQMPAGCWIRYEPKVMAAADDRWLGLLGLRAFKLLLCVAIVALMTMVFRNWLLRGTIPWADAITAGLLGIVLMLVMKKPAWSSRLTWVVLAALFLDVADGLSPWQQPVTATHLLLPMLVLYGALLCDIGITVVAAGGVVAVCVLTWLKFAPLSLTETMMLSNILLATLITGIAAYCVWTRHQQLMRDYRQQAEILRLELETNNKLNSVIFHDIANPLTALVGALDLAQQTGVAEESHLTLMRRMTDRINAIIRMVSAVNKSNLETAPREIVATDRIAADLKEIFASRLLTKQQTFVLTAGCDLSLSTVYDVLINTVLANLVSNAIKFSPLGSRIEMRAASEKNGLRIEICGQGQGFPPELFLTDCSANFSTTGTAGEVGCGLGLNIVSLYVGKIGGVLELRNSENGGGAASILLPVD